MGDLLLDCKGVDERLSGFNGRDVGGFCVGDCAGGAETSMCTRGVTCDACTGDDGGSGVAEALFKEVHSRVDGDRGPLFVGSAWYGSSGSSSCSIELSGSGSSESMITVRGNTK